MSALVGFMCILLACLAVCVLITMNVSNARHDATLADAHDRAVAQQAKQENDRLYRSAVAYNERLAQSGQPQLGFDPFAASSSAALGQNETKDYLAQLNKPADRIMATISYPKLGIKLPVYHGTSAEVLEQGAGHVAGTSLPVGGANTHAVISAHTGLANRQLFDALQVGRGAKIGDVFYIHVLDRTLAYKVDHISVIDPDDFDALRIRPGQDELTLLTCTPYGVNTQRLLVTGVRAEIPSQAPYESEAPKDHTLMWRLLAIGAGLALVVAAAWVAAFRSHNNTTRRRRAQARTPQRAQGPSSEEDNHERHDQ
ncbi:sortase [Bifidobacterium pseudolongum subsp. globosum]|uniref:Sortase n=1 Tax=Bifidobacterium pseudolongum subsp. globosum TaxID=1690 RepID=A0A4Q4ZZQ4_9BIFI|nr:class C sortase [Bifidobacterium pseudolongum]RYQ08490.1 sortase [Bifidobacterium pseudolongum subsp. globosum]